MMVWRQCDAWNASTGRLVRASALGLFLWLASCSGGEGPPDVVLTSIDLSPAAATLQVGANQQFSATGHYSDGSAASVAVNWTATGGGISAGGLYTAGSVAGNFQVVATQQGGSISKAATVTVTAAPPVLTSITVAPSTISLAPAATQQFAATGHYTGGGTGSVAVNWSATGGTINPAGLYTAGSTDGAYQVTATAQGTAIAGHADVTIATPPPNLVAIEIAPATLRIKPYDSLSYNAIGRRSDNSTVPVAVTWNATSSNLSSIKNSISAAGMFHAGTVLGTFTVTASEVGGTLTASVPVTVHTTTGLTVAPDSFAFWQPEAGKVYLCTSNHFTDDPVGLGGIAVTAATPAGGVTNPSVAYGTLGTKFYPDSSGEVKVFCQVVWSAPPPPNDAATVSITVTENAGSAMAKVFIYDKLVCYVDPPANTIERPCNRTDGTQLNIPDPNWTTLPVTATVTVSATTGANIWFKNTLPP